MKKMGTLFGVDLLLDTDDEETEKLANRYFEGLQRDLKELSELRKEKALDRIFNPL